MDGINHSPALSRLPLITLVALPLIGCETTPHRDMPETVVPLPAPSKATEPPAAPPPAVDTAPRTTAGFSRFEPEGPDVRLSERPLFEKRAAPQKRRRFTPSVPMTSGYVYRELYRTPCHPALHADPAALTGPYAFDPSYYGSYAQYWLDVPNPSLKFLSRVLPEIGLDALKGPGNGLYREKGRECTAGR
jgi:hypothetical protein